MENVPTQSLEEVFAMCDPASLVANYNPEWDDYQEPVSTLEQVLADFAEKEKADRSFRKAERAAKRIQDCGAWSYSFDIYNGRGKSFRFYCQMFRECQTCLTRRAELEQMHCSKTLKSGKKLVSVIMTAEESTRFARNTPKALYTRYPQLDGNELFIITPDLISYEMETVAIDDSWVRGVDWESIVFQPPKRNRSGLLCLPESPPNPKKFNIIEVKSIVSDAPAQEVLEAMKEVVEETSYMRPNDGKTVESCLNERVEKTINILRGKGYEITRYWKKLKVEHEYIDWSNPKIATGPGGISCNNTSLLTQKETVFLTLTQ